jgi:surface polysaccharide O-acyltransferase-like enzyme
MPDKTDIKNQRIESLDLLRGFALILIILFHSSVYNFANINKIDFSNPPIIVVLLSFMALWGGVFIIYSMAVNTIMILKRTHGADEPGLFLYPVLAGFIYIILHYVLNIFLGRWNNDFVYNRPDLTVVAGSLRNLHFTFPHISKFFEGTSLATIAFNLIILSLVLFLILRKDGIKRENRNYLILSITATLIMVFSFVRVPFFHLLTVSIENKNYFTAAIFSFTLANPYPLLPYLAYGLFGIVVGMMIFFNRRALLKKVMIPAGILFLIFGFSGMMNFEKSISKPDYFWYFKINFELGIFLLILVFTFLSLKPGTDFLIRMTIVKRFSRISLTIYMFETCTSEILRILYLSVYPSWNLTINGCLIFGGMNIILWIIILFFWSKIEFRYSLEYFWVKFFNSIGKNSTKMKYLP